MDGDEMGLFAVRLEPQNGSLVALLTGDHFTSGEAAVAQATIGVEARQAFLSGASPVYLVRDSVVGVAVQSMERAIRYGVPECHDGKRGKPCGTCATCRAAMRDAFSWAILGHLELPQTELSERVSRAIRSAVGMTWIDAPWSRPMTDEEVNDVFEQLGVSPRKENEDEAH